jgi:NADH dehydrogenase
VRCLVRDPRRLGEDRVRVQLTIGNLADPLTFPSALRGIDTVVHMAAATRDQKYGSIEALNATATWRLVQAAQTAGVKRFIFLSALSATRDNRSRFMRSKWAAERAVSDSEIDHTILAPSLVYAAGDPFQTLLKRLTILPVIPVCGKGQARYQPIWADDVADCVVATLDKPERDARYELAGPETLTLDDIARDLLAGLGKKRPFIHVPAGAVRPALKTVHMLLRSRAPVSWDEVQLMEVPRLSERGTADAESLGVTPLPLRAALKQ